MIRVILGSAAAAVAMFIIGFIFFATPLSGIAFAKLDDSQAAAVQASLAANLPRTATYVVPGVDTPAQTNMYSRGPVATVHYNTGGFAAMDTGALAQGLVLNFITALLIGVALMGIDGRVGDFSSRARTVAIVAVAATVFTRLGEPIYMHHDWGHFVYLFVTDALMLVAAGVIVAWFMPVRAEAAPAAPVDEAPAKA
jgi:hypothetical protein